MAEIKSKGAAPPNPLANPPAIISATFDATKPKADFMDSNTGAGERRLAWANSNVGGNGFSWSLGMWSPGNSGGRHARDAATAARVSTEMLTSNSVIWTLVQNATVQTVGTGLTLSSKPRASEIGISPEAARELSNAIEQVFKAWAGNPQEADSTGRHDLHSLAAAAFRSYMTTGEVLAVLDWKSLPGARTKTKVTLLDPDMLDRSYTKSESGINFAQGVGFKDGRVVAYAIREIPLGSPNSAPQAKVVSAFTSWGRPRVLHLFSADDPRQVRGISPLIGALTPSKEQDTLAELEIAKAQMHASATWSITSDLPAPAAYDALSIDDQKSGIAPQSLDNWFDTRETFYSKAKIRPAAGSVYHLLPNDKLELLESKSPSNSFDAFDKSLMRKAAKSSGSSWEDLSGDYSQTSYSASRLAMALPHQITLKRRKDIVERFYATVFACWLEEAIAAGTIRLPKGAADFWDARDAYCNAKFLGSGMVQPDPKKAREATILGLKNGLLSLTDAYAEDGRDFEAEMETLIAEKAYLESIGLQHPFWADKQPQPTERAA